MVCEHARHALARWRDQRNVDGGEIAALRAEEQAAGFDRLLEQLLGRQVRRARAGECPAAHVLRTILRRFTGFVIGDAQDIARGVFFHQIDGAAQPDAIQNVGFVAGAG